MAHRILVVDDSPVVRLILQDMLEALGHKVVAQAESAAGAIAAFREGKHDVVLLDISLPDGEGLSVLREMRQIDPSARVFIVTGNAQKALREQAIESGALGLLQKPFDAKELAALLGQIGEAASSGAAGPA